MHLLGLLAFLSVLTLGVPGSAPVGSPAATDLTDGQIPVLSMSQQDLNRDGQPDVALIDCAFATGYDRVLVYDQGGDMQMGSQWQAVTDFENDVWVFDVGADGTAQLMVKFAVIENRYVALVYVDTDEDGQVNYHLDENRVVIDESDFWIIKVETDRPWAQPEGLAETPITFLMDGFASSRQESGRIQQNDGTVDWLVEVGDQNGDGINDYAIRYDVNPILQNTPYRGTTIYAQTHGRKPSTYANSIFWPLLVSTNDVGGNYFDHIPAIAVDWETGIVEQVGVLGFPSEEGYHIGSRMPLLDKSSVSALNWENPMAYFDMAQDQDGQAELQIRFEVAVPYDLYFPYPYAEGVSTPNVEVNYSWDQNNDGRWDYKLNVSSNDPIDEVVEFPDFAVKSVPHDEIVSWVNDRSWDMAMLVFDSQPPSGDSEGMFGRGWMISRGHVNEEHVNAGVKESFMMGFSDELSTRSFQDIEEAMRGEYNFSYYDTPRIYLSSLDRQLHLFGAEAGIWNRGEGHRLRYANLNADTYIDQWQDERDGSVVQQLNYAAGVYVYSGNDQVHLKLTDLPQALLETRPPGDHDEWQRLDAQLNDHQTTLEPDDFTGMLDQLPGSDLRIQGAAARDFRITQQGFHFVLELPDGFRAEHDQNALLPLPQAPGSYVVSYTGGAWSVQPATPAAPRVAGLQVTSGDGAPRALGWSTVAARVRNDGLEDIHNLVVCATLDHQAGHQIVLTDTLSLLPGEGELLVAWDWSPPAAGSWQVQVAADCNVSEGASLDGQGRAGIVVEVSDAAQPSVPWMATVGGGVSGSIVLFLGAAVAVAGLAAALWTKRSAL